MLRHIVLLKIKPGTSQELINEMYENVFGFKEKIPGIVSISGGPNISPEGIGRGYTGCFVIDFVDAAARDKYLPHPEHKRVGTKYIKPITDGIDNILAFNIEIKD